MEKDSLIDLQLQWLIITGTITDEHKGISFNPDITANIVNYNKLLPYKSTSSMHRDYQNLKQKTEVETLTGYVVRAGRELGIETPSFTRVYNQLISKKQNH